MKRKHEQNNDYLPKVCFNKPPSSNLNTCEASFSNESHSSSLEVSLYSQPVNDLELANEPHIFSEAMASYCNTREKRVRLQKFNDDSSFDRVSTQTIIYGLDFQLREEHDCVPYFITITFPRRSQDVSLEEEWREMPKVVEFIMKHISKSFLVAGGIISLEPHKNTTLKDSKAKPRGKNTKAGRPHIHMNLWLYNTFLSPKVQMIAIGFQKMGWNVKLRKSIKHEDVVKSSLYTLKNIKNDTLKTIVQGAGISHNSMVWSNNPDTRHFFENFYCTFDKDEIAYKETNFSITPTVRKYNSDTLRIGELMYKLCLVENLATFNGYIYKKVDNTSFCWYRYQTLKWWLNSRWNFDMPQKYMEMLKQALPWLKSAIEDNQDSSNQILPQLNPSMHLIEFKDGVYDLQDAKFLKKETLSSNTSCICYYDIYFNSLPFPGRTLASVFALTAYPIKLGTSDDEILYEFSTDLANIGSTLHPMPEQRTEKKAPGFYLEGTSDTFKTTLSKAWLEAIRPGHLDQVARSKGPFNLDSLSKPQGCDFLWFNDDARWANSGLNIAQFLNLLDGGELVINPKHLRAYNKALIGAVVTTSNEGLEALAPKNAKGEYEPGDLANLKVLRKRLRTIYFKGRCDLYSQFRVSTHELRHNFIAESLSFMLYCGALYLRISQPPGRICHLPNSWPSSQNTKDSLIDQSDYRILNNTIIDQLGKTLGQLLI